jgi:hypothetical protein
MRRWRCSTGWTGPPSPGSCTRSGRCWPRGFAVPGKPGLRLKTLADVFAYAASQGVRLRVDGTEVQVRRPKAGRPGRRAFVSGKKSAPPKKPGKSAPADGTALWEQQRHQQSSARICVEHAIAEPKQWRPLQRWTGRRDYFQETALAIAGLVSDQAATR